MSIDVFIKELNENVTLGTLNEATVDVMSQANYLAVTDKFHEVKSLMKEYNSYLYTLSERPVIKTNKELMPFIKTARLVVNTISTKAHSVTTMNVESKQRGEQVSMLKRLIANSLEKYSLVDRRVTEEEDGTYSVKIGLVNMCKDTLSKYGDVEGLYFSGPYVMSDIDKSQIKYTPVKQSYEDVLNNPDAVDLDISIDDIDLSSNSKIIADNRYGNFTIALNLNEDNDVAEDILTSNKFDLLSRMVDDTGADAVYDYYAVTTN